MRLPDFCNRPTTRAPYGLPDSRARCSSSLAALGATPIRLQPMASGGSPGRASLDGEPPASAPTQPSESRVFEAGAPDTNLDGTLHGPGGASIERSSVLRLPIAVFSTANRACDVASDALCRGVPRSSGLSAEPTRQTARPASTAVSSKTTASSKPGRLPSTSALSPVQRLSPLSGIVESPPPFSQFCHHDPASDALLPPEHEAG
jgi:hypothetical protein